MGSFQGDLDKIRSRRVERGKKERVEVVVVQDCKESFWPSDEDVMMTVVQIVKVTEGPVVMRRDSLSEVGKCEWKAYSFSNEREMQEEEVEEVRSPL